MASVDWTQMLAEYDESKKVQGVTESTLYEIALSLRNFKDLTDCHGSRQLSQSTIDKFILLRGKQVQRGTLNKDIRNIKAFIKWAKKKRYVNDDIEIHPLKEDERPVKSLNDEQIKKLLAAFESYPSMKMRILLALGTGLRRGDIDTLKASDVDLTNCNLATQSRKTRKSMGARPVPKPVINELKKYLEDLPQDQDMLFSEEFNYKQWRRVCSKAGMPGLKFHDLRKTFASALAQNGASTAVTQRLLEHSSPTLTNKVYLNVDPVLRQVVDKLPIESWMGCTR